MKKGIEKDSYSHGGVFQRCRNSAWEGRNLNHMYMKKDMFLRAATQLGKEVYFAGTRLLKLSELFLRAATQLGKEGIEEAA